MRKTVLSLFSGKHEVRGEIAAMLRIGMPVIFTNMTLMVMHVTDAWMLGMLGSEALAAVTPPGLFIFMLQSFGYSFLTSITAFVAQSFGKGERTRCGHYAWQGVILSAGIGLLVLFFRPAAEPLFAFFANESPRVFEMEVAYFQISLFSIGPSLITIAVSNFFIGIQKTSIAMISAVIGLVSNVILSYGLIFGAFGFPEWGFEGAAWGTVFATLIEAAVILALFMSPERGRVFATRKARFSIEDQRRIVQVGFPAGVQGAIDVVSWGMIVSWLVAFFGTAHQAAATVLIRCMQVSFLPAEGIALAALTLVGNAVGARDFRLAERRAGLAFKVIGAYMTGLGVLFYVFREPILEFFSDDPEVVAIGMAAMIFVSLFQLFDAMGIVYVHALQAAGDNAWPSIVNAVLCFGLLLGGGLVIVRFFPDLSSRGIWALTGFYILGQGLAFRFRWRSGKWKEIDLFSTAAETP